MNSWRCLCIWTMLLCAATVFASEQDWSGSLRGSQLEIQYLRQQIADAKSNGTPVDPAWMTRLNEIEPPQAPSVEMNFPEYESLEPESSQIENPYSPLEQQIRDLEATLFSGSAAAADQPVITPDLKDQLAALYAQRPENQPGRNPLDQGSDDCTGITDIPSAPFDDAGTTAGRANDFTPSPTCGTTNAPDVIYRFTPLVTATYTLSLGGSLYDTYLYVRTGGACPGTTQVGCNDDLLGLQSYLSLTLTGGTTYYIIVDGHGTNAGQYVLHVRDDCEIMCGNEQRQECEENTDSTNAGGDCDGACNNPDYGGPVVSLALIPGQSICGQLFTYIGPGGGQFRDTDWYGFSITEQCTVRWTARAEYPVELFLFGGDCSFTSLAHTTGGPCTNLSVQAVLNAGNYFAWIGPNFFGPVVPKREYLATLQVRPTACHVDGQIVAPGSFTGNTCGAGNDCNLRPSEEQTIQVVIPFGGLQTWRFSLCSSGQVWDSYLYLPFGNSTCCSPNPLAVDDDFCGSFGLSQITHCVQPDLYYVTIEGFDQTNCGTYTLTVTKINGSCCYGDSTNPQCQEGLADCQCENLSGVWHEGLLCANTVCGPRPTCQDDASFGQLPFIASEAWDANTSDEDPAYRCFENFSGLTRPIGSVRFWGVGGLFPCTEQPQAVLISFHPDSSGWPRVNAPVATYNLSLTGTPVGTYSIGPNNYTVFQYDAQLAAPCSLFAGWISVQGKAVPGSTDCDFYWLRSPQGNGTFLQSNNNSFPNVATGNLAFCLAGQPACNNQFTLFPGFSVVASSVQLAGHRHVQLNWYISGGQPGNYEVWSTTSPNNDGDPDGGLDSLWRREARLVISNPNGIQTWVDPDSITSVYKNYVVIQSCRPSSDDCEYAMDITNGLTNYTNVNASTDGGPSCGAIGSDIWFRYAATCTGTVTVNTCLSGTGSHDTVLDIYDGSCSGVDVVCNDDACGVDGLKSQVQFASTTGHTYYIRAAGYNGSQGRAILNISCQ